MRLRISSNGEVTVSAPLRISNQTIEKFVIDHLDWITKHQARVKDQHRTDPETVLVFGKAYRKVIDQELKFDHPVTIVGNDIHILPVTRTKASVERAITSFVKHTAQKYIVPRTQQLAEIMQLTFSSITLRDQKTRWGSCSSVGGLNFNWRLVQYGPAVIDYVIVHELAHRREMNHSDRFWAIVAKYDPEYQAHRRWLKKYGSTVD